MRLWFVSTDCKDAARMIFFPLQAEMIVEIDDGFQHASWPGKTKKE